MQEEIVQFKRLRADAVLPARATVHSAGYDLYALEDVTITGGMGNFIVPTGIAAQLPPGTYGRIAVRSGLAVKQHLCVGAGVIDVDFTGQICVVVYSTLVGSHYTIDRGERFAQLIIERVSYADCIEVEEFSRDYEPHVGYGSTGDRDIKK
jgi:dUTP pyrophosphatase